MTYVNCEKAGNEPRAAALAILKVLQTGRKLSPRSRGRGEAPRRSYRTSGPPGLARSYKSPGSNAIAFRISLLPSSPPPPPDALAPPMFLGGGGTSGSLLCSDTVRVFARCMTIGDLVKSNAGEAGSRCARPSRSGARGAKR